MSSPLLETRAPAHTQQHQNLNNGQISHPFSFDFSGFSLQNQSEQYQSLSHTMNPSNAGDVTSGFSNSNDINSNFGFNTSSLSRQGSGLARPRFVKVRRGLNAQNFKPPESPETGFRPGFNPFRTNLESSIPVPSGLETGTSVSGEFGTPKSGNEGKMFGANRSDSNANSGKWDSNASLRKGVIDEMRNLKIGSGNEFLNTKEGAFSFNARSRVSSSSAAGLDKGGFVFGNGYRKNSSIDESIGSKLPEDMMKLNIEGPENAESVEKGKGVKFNVTATDKTKFGLGNNDNVGGSLGQNLESELPNELKKLNIKETVQLDRSTDTPNADCVYKFAFGNSKKDSYSFSGSSENILPDLMKNLNIKDHADMSDRDNPAFTSGKTVGDTFDGRKGTLLSRKMEKLNLGSRAGDSTQSHAGTPSHQTSIKHVETGNCGDKLFHNLDKPIPREFPFQVAMQGRNAGGCDFSSDQPKDEAKSCGTTPSGGIHFEPVGGTSEMPAVDRPEKRDEFYFTSKQDGLGGHSVEFKTPNTKANLFSGINKKLESGARRESFRDTRKKKTTGKPRRSSSAHLGPRHDFVSREGSSQENVEASASYSPMDVSPYQETLADNQCAKENSVASGESFSILNNHSAADSVPTVSNDPIDEDLAMATGRLDINEVDATSRETRADTFEYGLDGSVDVEGTLEGSVSEVETESFKSAAEEVDFSRDNSLTAAETEASSSSNIERHDIDARIHFGFPSTSEDRTRSNFTFAASSAAQSQLSASKRLHKKKNLVKEGQDTNVMVPNVKVPYASSSANFFPYPGASVHMSPRRSQKIDLSIPQHKYGDNSGVCKEKEIRQESGSPSAETAAAQEACEKWRLRGNQAYCNGDPSKAEDCYTKGVNCISRNETSKSCLRALMLCYSNRAATRMTLGRLRDALGDCMMAAGIDPNFLKAQVRAANCYLALGEVEDASQHFRRCLQLANDVCVDRKIAVEASDGLQKAQKVSECLNLSAELLQWKISTNAERALELIAEGLVMSPSSEKLLEMKAEALFMMRRYEEVIELCEQTLGSAEKNNPSIDTNYQALSSDGSELSKYFYFRLWRCRVIFKSYFHLGKLEEGLASLEKQDEKVSTYRNWRKTLESSVPLVLTVRELLSHKAAGNEAFQAGRHTEAVEHYTAALSCNVESRPFTAVCFCNRAAAYKALGQMTDAIADCSLAIALDGNYQKAISRRATLYEMIRDYGQAARDLQRLVSLLTKQVEGKTNHCGTSDRSISCTNDLRQARLRLSGIEEEDRKDIPLDMYLILGVEPSVSAAEIKKAYRKAALRHHPDKAGQFFARSDNGDDGVWREIAEEVHKDADRLFKMIGEAYAVLSDPTKRSRYDAEEEMRNAQKKRSGSSTSRMPADVQNYPFERSSSRRQWSYGNSSARGSEATWSSRYS